MIRHARPTDADRLAEVTLASWRAAYSGLLPGEFLDGMSLQENRGHWYSNLANVAFTSFLAESAGRVRGYINLWPDRRGSAAFEITALYVHPEFWRLGVGGGLMRRGLDCIAGRGSDSVWLWVLEANDRARAFYEVCGFSLTERRREDRSFGGATVRECLYRLQLPAPHQTGHARGAGTADPG